MTCPRCGHENLPRAKFCSECGNRLERHAVSAVEERKVVTVLFADIVGFTARSDEADPEDVKAFLRPYHARLKEEIERKGGTVDKFIGDGVLAVFGAPRAHEDDPERAVLAALAIKLAIEELNEADLSLQLSARMGINTGEVVVSFAQGPVIGERITGDVVNTASRLQSVAEPGGIVVGEATYRATRDRFQYRELPPATVKGKHEPLLIWEPTASRGRGGAEALTPPTTPMVGRDVELAMLKELYGRAVRDGSPMLVSVVGEPGIGKSRIVRELARYIDSLTDVIVTWRQGRCLPYGEGMTFWALSEIVRAHAGILDSDPPDVASAKLRSAVDALSLDRAQVDWIRSRLAPLVGLVREDAEATDDQNELFTAWRRFFETVAMDRPLVLLFEDLQWADDALLAFIEHLAEWAAPVPMLIICAARPELLDRRAGWGGGKRNSMTIALPPLSKEDTGALLSALLENTELPADTRSAIISKAGGNPLYAEEFVRMLFDPNVRLGARPAPLAQNIPVPETVHALIATRLDALPPVEKALLHDASVVGEVFWVGTVAAMAGVDEAEADRRLQQLGRKELVRPRPASTIDGQHEYAFWHSLVRDVCYGQIPRSARAPKHLAVASWSERIAGDRAGDYAELLAYHHGMALELYRVHGSPQQVAQLAQSTARFLMIAGDRAMSLDNARASAHYARALQLLPEDSPDRGRLLVGAAEAAGAAGRLEEAERDYEEAEQLFRAAGDDLALGETLARRARNMHRVGDSGPAGVMAEEAVRLLERQPPSTQLARAYGRAAGMALVGGRYEESLELAGKALDLAERLGLQDEVVRARQFRGSALCELGNGDGVNDLREAARMGLELGLGEETALAYGNLAYQLWLREGPTESLSVWDKATEFAQQRGFEMQAMWSRNGQLEALFDLGRWDELLEISERVIAWDESRGGSQVGTVAGIYRANALVRRDRVDEAEALIVRILPRVRTIAYAEFLSPALMTAALVEEARGERAAMRDLVDELVGATEAHPNYRVQYLSEIVRMHLAGGGSVESARAMIPAEDPLWPRRLQLSHLSARAVVAEAADDLAGALALYDEAAEAWGEYGFGLVRALSLMGAARVLNRLGRPQEARDRLRGARTIVVDVGAAHLLGESEGTRPPQEEAAVSSPRD
jgi:class 3 adenylate cyclase/tetratricopeptide (TPR) repeat protein